MSFYRTTCGHPVLPLLFTLFFLLCLPLFYTFFYDDISYFYIICVPLASMKWMAFFGKKLPCSHVVPQNDMRKKAIVKCRSIERHADILFYPFFSPVCLTVLTPFYIVFYPAFLVFLYTLCSPRLDGMDDLFWRKSCPVRMSFHRTTFGNSDFRMSFHRTTFENLVKRG